MKMLDDVDRAIKDIAAGRPVVVVDDEWKSESYSRRKR
jgi:3,4-dihydroxy-2-butanone 4-phosphate synthase